MAGMHCTIVDVFAEAPLSGNQLAVVRNCGHLDARGMQAIAREMNFSETTFVTEEREGMARVRIFTPAQELSFAGHPTLGTAWVLGRDQGAYTLHLDTGPVPVTFDADGVAWMTPPPVELGPAVAPASAAALLGLNAEEIDPGYPCRLATVGPAFVLAGVTGLEALRRMAVDPAVHHELRERLGRPAFLGVFAFAAEAYGDADFAVRFFMDGSMDGRFREDPATGSANTAFAALLASLDATGRRVVEQGFEIQRPSRLYLDIQNPVRVGGRVRPVMAGLFDDALDAVRGEEQ